MILTLHNLAKTYKMLPSEILERGTTFDLYVLDTFSRYVKYQEARAQGRSMPSSGKPKLSIEQMKAMMEVAKNTVMPKG